MFVLTISFLQRTVLNGLLNPVWDVSTGQGVSGLSGLLRALVLWAGRRSAFQPSLTPSTGHSAFGLFFELGPTYTKQLGSPNFPALRELKVTTKITILGLPH